MAVVIASALRKELSGSVLFDGVSFKVERGDRLALAGPNGAGKTTLLRALVGEVSLEGGELAWEKGARVALHDQRPPAQSGRPLREYVLAGTADLVALEGELRRLEQAMAAGDHAAATLRRYAEAQARLEHAGGYDWRDRAAQTLRGLGFGDADLDRPLASFSGGELTRASLARALASQPDLLLLDEPTNHLDIESLEWLEQLLRTLDAAVILVAHDRWFLEAVTTAVLELEGGKSVYFPGAWHVWRREQAARDVHLARTAARQAEQIARLERFVERFRYKATKARQAQSKLKQIERLQARRVTVPDASRRTLGFEFLRPARSGRDVVVAEGLVVRAGSKALLDDATFAIERGEHVALVGPNGSGKTTLLETILGRRSAAGGRVRLGHGVVPAYFSQHEAELDERGSVLDAAMAGTGLKRPEAQSLLGRFLFSGWDEHEKPVAALSGGERRRLALAIVVASGANLLVLDEPTNHLDLESRESLEAALEAFPGTVLLVSHDRALLDAVAGRLLAIEGRELRSYPGGWADYVRAQEAEAAPAAAAPAPKPRRGRPAKPARPAPSPLELVERDVERAEARLAELERRLAEDWADTQLIAEHGAARAELAGLIARWEALVAAGEPQPR
ncbi:MAG TPA: ABC-F family ATP-binding cassette domain-containing protein [Gaiellaceae bacterium]|nr:ABC-F family ATP-binding cassette domain-containing protein [Gaiellaceae bacterium]